MSQRLIDCANSLGEWITPEWFEFERQTEIEGAKDE